MSKRRIILESRSKTDLIIRARDLVVNDGWKNITRGGGRYQKGYMSKSSHDGDDFPDEKTSENAWMFVLYSVELEKDDFDIKEFTQDFEWIPGSD